MALRVTSQMEFHTKYNKYNNLTLKNLKERLKSLNFY